MTEPEQEVLKEVIDDENHTEQLKEVERLTTVVKKVIDYNPSMNLVSLFINGDSQKQNDVLKLSISYLRLAEAKAKNNKDEETKWLNIYNDFLVKTLPDMSEEEVAAILSLYLHFTRRYADKALKDINDIKELDTLVSRVLIKDEFNNDIYKKIIRPIYPKSKKMLTKKERIMRSFRQAGEDGAISYDMYLNNSYIMLRFARPQKLDLFRLIDEIERTLQHFGARWMVPSFHLERAGIARIITNFILSRTKWHSVQDVMDPQELKPLILANDIDTMANGILQSATNSGVQYNMICLANKCNQISTILSDPYEFELVNDIDLNDFQRDLRSKVISGNKVSIDDILKAQNDYSFGGVKVEDRILLYRKESIDDFIDESNITTKPYGELKLAVPDLNTYFTCFDIAAEKLDKDIKTLILDYPDPKVFRKKRSEFMSTMRMVDYIHWISEYRIYSEEPSEEDTIENRDDGHREFDEGLCDSFDDNDDLYIRTLNKIVSLSPYMTHCWHGIYGNECPHCKNRASEENSNPIAVNHGFTPIDMVTSFFDHTQILLNARSLIQDTIEESIS